MEEKNRKAKRAEERKDWFTHPVVATAYKVWRFVFAAVKIAAGAIATVLLIALVCGFVFVCMLGDYLQEDIIPQAGMDMNKLGLELNSTIYYIDSNNQIQIQQNIHSNINRKWAYYDDIPEDMINAAVAIEDHRFYQHQGVDWVTTLQACARMFFGDDSAGGSSITQQLVKNITQNDSITVQRKVLEIFQATQLEKSYSKEDILEHYLNVVYFGQSSYGARQAAKAYFGKELEKLSLAECACIVGITNSPTYYDPYQNPANNLRRTQTILWTMKNQGMIDQEEYNAAIVESETLAERLKWYIDFEDTLAYCDNEDCGYKDTVSTLAVDGNRYFCPNCSQEVFVTKNVGGYNYHTETVIWDVAKDLAAKEGVDWNSSTYDMYIKRIQVGGYQIYSTMDYEVQQQVDKIYSDLKQMPSYRGGDQLQSSIVVIDNRTGDIVGCAGGFGPKDGAYGWNRVVRSTRQSGSSIKPISIYAPAFEMGVITPVTVVKDLPLTYDGGYWPRNDNWQYSYSRTILSGVTSSVNAIATNTLKMITTDYGYDFAKNKFGLSTLVDEYYSGGTRFSDNNYAPLAMGAQTWGVTVRDMAAAFGTFANNGVWREARSYTKVLDSNGNVVLDNTQDSRQILGEKAVNYMNYCLVNATRSGTGTEADLYWSYGITTAGKTGTTADNYDRWYCGYTGYYTAAVWTGFDEPQPLYLTYGGNPSAQLFKKVMGPLHYGKSNKSLYSERNMTYVSVCLDSGKLATDACYVDVRVPENKSFTRVNVGMVHVNDAPDEYCDKHVMVEYCSGGGVANEYCKLFAEVDEEVVVAEKSLVKMTQADIVEVVRARDEAYGLWKEWRGQEYIYYVDSKGNDLVFKGLDGRLSQSVDAPYVLCTEHTKEAWDEYVLNHPVVPEEPVDPSDPTNPDDSVTPDEPEDTVIPNP